MGDRLSAIVRAQFAENMLDVLTNGKTGNRELSRNLFVTVTAP
jgi:hypothetical protein